jgi:beta-glucosidase
LDNYKGATTILEGIKTNYNGTLVYDKNATANHFDADVAIIVVGETPYAEFFGDIGHESNTRKLTLTKEHQKYISTYSKQGVKTIVVLISGRPLVVTQQIKQSTAFVAAWLPGSEGHGIAEVLFGDFNFSGKLPHSWPKSIRDFDQKYGPNFWDKNTKPLYPFGYGLSYKIKNDI